MAADWRGYPPLRLLLDECGPGHEVRWRDGRVDAPAHSIGEGDAERVLEALGGSLPPCLAVVDAWPLLCGPDLPATVHLLEGPTPGPTTARPRRSVPLRPAGHDPARAAAGGGRRLAVADFHRLAWRRRRAEQVGDCLPAAWTAIRLAAFVESLGAGGWSRLPSRERRILTGAVRLLARDALAAAGQAGRPLRVDDGGRPAAAPAGGEVHLPVLWVARVWARGAAVVDGAFVLSLEPPGGEGPWHADTTAGPMALRPSAGRWARL